MVRNTTPSRVFASSVLCYAFVRPCVFLLKIRDFKDSIRILHFDFAGERDTASSSPAYFWDRAAKKKKNKRNKGLAIRRCDQSVIQCWRKVDETEALWFFFLQSVRTQITYSIGNFN